VSLSRWLSDVLTASRYCHSLEQRLIQERQDFTERLGEKDARIKELRTELAGAKLEGDRMRLALMPLASPAGAMYAEQANKPRPPVIPAFSGSQDWQSELRQLIEEEERDGIRERGRIQEHEPGADAPARAVDDGKEV
jgi:HPt (histidine-containing phosphotransfer) domain-containing protein